MKQRLTEPSFPLLKNTEILESKYVLQETMVKKNILTLACFFALEKFKKGELEYFRGTIFKNIAYVEITKQARERHEKIVRLEKGISQSEEEFSALNELINNLDELISEIKIATSFEEFNRQRISKRLEEVFESFSQPEISAFKLGLLPEKWESLEYDIFKFDISNEKNLKELKDLQYKASFIKRKCKEKIPKKEIITASLIKSRINQLKEELRQLWKMQTQHPQCSHIDNSASINVSTESLYGKARTIKNWI